MEGHLKKIVTSTGRLTISGPLESLEDLSYSSIASGPHLSHEIGYQLFNFTKPSQETISTQFKVRKKQVLNEIFLQDKYINMEVGKAGPLYHLNRYIDVLPCKSYSDERNSVKLPEFINASYISGPEFPNQTVQYIATQGPLPHTISAFWKMV